MGVFRGRARGTRPLRACQTPGAPPDVARCPGSRRKTARLIGPGGRAARAVLSPCSLRPPRRLCRQRNARAGRRPRRTRRRHAGDAPVGDVHVESAAAAGLPTLVEGLKERCGDCPATSRRDAGYFWRWPRRASSDPISQARGRRCEIPGNRPRNGCAWASPHTGNTARARPLTSGRRARRRAACGRRALAGGARRAHRRRGRAAGGSRGAAAPPPRRRATRRRRRR